MSQALNERELEAELILGEVQRIKGGLFVSSGEPLEIGSTHRTAKGHNKANLNGVPVRIKGEATMEDFYWQCRRLGSMDEEPTDGCKYCYLAEVMD